MIPGRPSATYRLNVDHGRKSINWANSVLPAFMIMPFRKIRRVIFRRFQIDTTLCNSESLVSNGVWQFGHSFNRTVVTEDGKNENSADRDVPIHPALLEAGLLDYVATCSGRLFPKVTCANEVQSKAYSKWWGRYLTTLGITAKSKVFHSFRHLFKDLCRNAGLDDSAIDQICGHEPGTVGGRYGSGRRIDVLAKLIAQITPPIPLPVITVRRRPTKVEGGGVEKIADAAT